MGEVHYFMFPFALDGVDRKLQHYTLFYILQASELSFWPGPITWRMWITRCAAREGLTARSRCRRPGQPSVRI